MANLGFLTLLTYVLAMGAISVIVLLKKWFSEHDGHPIRLFKRYVHHFRAFWCSNLLCDSTATLLLIVPLLFLVDAVHEGSHCLASIVATGTHPDLYVPFPMKALGTAEFGVSIGLRGGVFAAPQFVQLAILALLTPLLLLQRSILRRFYGLHVCLRTYFLATTGGLAWNVLAVYGNGKDSSADWPRYQQQHSISNGSFFALSVAMLLVPATHFLWVSYAPMGRTAEDFEDLGLFAKHPNAPSWTDYSIPGCLGVVAGSAYFLTAVTTANDSFFIEKDNAVFRIPLAVNVASVLLWLVYLIVVRVTSCGRAQRAENAARAASVDGRLMTSGEVTGPLLATETEV